MLWELDSSRTATVPVTDQPSVSIHQRNNGTPRARRPVADHARGISGARRNPVAVSGPRFIDTREHDRLDMARLADGDEGAMVSLMQRHAVKLLRHLERMVRNRSDAEALVNEAFIRVFRHRLDFNHELRFSTWLYVIGSHLAINLLRWRARRPEHVPLPEAVGNDTTAVTDALIDPAPTPREQAENDEWTDALIAALGRLPMQLRAPLLLVSFDGCSQAEVAERLGCTAKAVEARLYHGRKRLRHDLEAILSPWRVRVEAAMRPRENPGRHPISSFGEGNRQPRRMERAVVS